MGEPHVVTEIDILERFSQLKEELRDDVFRRLTEFRADLDRQVTAFGNIVDGNVAVLQSVQERVVRLQTETLPALQKQIVGLEISTTDKAISLSSDLQEFQQKIIPLVLGEILELGKTIQSDTTAKNETLLGRITEFEVALQGIQKATSENVAFLADKLEEAEKTAGLSVADLSARLAGLEQASEQRTVTIHEALSVLSQKGNSLEEKLNVLVDAELARQAKSPWYKRIAQWMKRAKK